MINFVAGNVAEKLGLNSKPDNEKPVRNTGKDSSVVVVVHSDAIINIDRCIKALDDRIGLEYTKKTIDADTEVMKKLSDKEVKNKLSFSKILTFDYQIKFERQIFP
jgi:hypothetical protein